MARETKLRTRTQEGKVEVLVLISHPMETGMRKDKASGKPIPAHFIKELVLEHNGKHTATANLGIGVSENPLIGFRLSKAKNGDKSARLHLSLKVSSNLRQFFTLLR